MNRYQPATPRAVAALAATLMTVATLAIAILAPASMDSTARDVVVASTAVEQPAHAAAGAITTSIDVVARRTTTLVPVVSTRATLRRNLAS